MNARQFFDALNEIDDRYLTEAEQWAAPVKRRSKFRRTVGWSAPAACLCLILAACFWNLAAPAQTEPNESARAGTGQPLPEDGGIPRLAYQTESSGDSVSVSGCYAGPSEGSSTRALTPEELASIWGEQDLSWEGVPVPEQYLVEGQVIHEPDGALWNVTILGYCSEEARENGMSAFQIELFPDMMPPMDLDSSGMQYNEIWGTQVIAVIQGGGRGYGEPGASGGYFSEITCYSAAFLRTSGESVGVRAEMTVDEMGLEDEEARDLLDRLVSQSLRPETELRLSQLEP